MKEKKDKVVHVEFHDGYLQPTEKNPEGKHFYFGSIAAIYDKQSNKEFDPKALGICRQNIYRYGLSPEMDFSNRNCTIKIGSVVRKSGDRKPPVKVIRVGEI